MKRIAGEHIKELQPNEIFVFGSNLAGRHGKGAALEARDFGARLGVGYGLQGNTFALPTKDAKLRVLPLSSIASFAASFIEFAKSNPEKIFLVTAVGCGYAGYSPGQVAPLFKEAAKLENIYLPESFYNILNP